MQKAKYSINLVCIENKEEASVVYGTGHPANALQLKQAQLTSNAQRSLTAFSCSTQ